jgi:hypothetical protein
MIQRHLLAALAHGISADDDLAARDALAHIDPVLRGRARKRLGTALLDAELACTTGGLARPSRAHVMRLAALAIAKRDAAAPADVDATTAAYAQLPATKRGGAPVATLATVGALAAIGGGIAFAIVTRPGPASRNWVKPQPQPSAAAYTTGGVPLHDAAIEKVLDGELTDLVIHVNRDLTSAEPELKTVRGE